ncbi:hypothetical protein B0A49_03143 [Cryomyces minteri]|uniref:Uncharacterized protein n=1 Tax=Cryomyces minteri TaxID=331657 RepID=A0A4U0XQ68_9PEZI|nr:hypothetical protein B0A49_03143 [Cryomyces minteri]
MFLQERSEELKQPWREGAMVSNISSMVLRLANRATADAVLQNGTTLRQQGIAQITRDTAAQPYGDLLTPGVLGRKCRRPSKAEKEEKERRDMARRGGGIESAPRADEEEEAVGERGGGSIDEEDFEEDFDDRSSMELVGAQSSGILTQGIRSHSPSQAEAGDGWSRKQKAPRHWEAD